MRQSIGGTWLLQLMILFILLFVGFIVLTLNYSRTIKLKNEMVSIVEKYEGLNSNSIKLVNNYLRTNNYTTTGQCDTSSGVYGSLSLENNSLEETKENTNYYYCIKKYKGANTSNYYQITVFYKFNLPVVGSISRFAIKGTTSNFQCHDEDKYCTSVDGTCVKKTAKNYNVKFDLNGGSGYINSQTIAQGEKVIPPNDPTRVGYKFLGWTFNGGGV